MGAGKSTIGRLLSSRLGYEFLDTDHLIEQKTGADIPWIFEIEGEEGFRQRETAILKQLCELDSSVIATGGGIVVKQENIPIVRELGTVFYLCASIEQLVERTSKDRKRPLLQVPDPRKKIEEILSHRDPLYRQVADHVVLTEELGTKAVVQSIYQILKDS